MISFLVFADLHYKKGMYAVSVQDLKQIMARAAENHVDFVLHAGDFSNDYSGSPEIVKEYLKDIKQIDALVLANSKISIELILAIFDFFVAKILSNSLI